MTEQPTVLQSIYPLVAPLSVPMAEHLVRRFERKMRASPVNAWNLLVKEVADKREVAFIYMNPFIQARQGIPSGERLSSFSTGWLLRTLTTHSPEKKSVPLQTLSNWHNRGLLRYEQHGLPDADSAAALFMARMIDTGERNWLPTSIREDEPAWWCWRQDSPDQHPVPCPVPLPASLAPETVLWTPWRGAAWNREWFPVGKDLGAIRFSGVKRVGRQFRWNVSYEALHHWAPHVVGHTSSPLIVRSQPVSDENAEEMRQQMLHTLAIEVLQYLALTRFDALKGYAAHNRS